MIDVIKDNELKDTLTNYIVYADFVGKKDNRRCTKCYDATEVLIATKKYDEMGSCHIFVCDKTEKEFSFWIIVLSGLEENNIWENTK